MRVRFAISQVLLLLSVIFELLLPLFIQRIVDEGITSGDLGLVFDNALLMVLATILATVFTVGTSWYAASFAEGAAHTLRQMLYQRIQALSFGNLDRFHTSDLLVRLTADINGTKMVMLSGTLIFMRLPFMLLGAIAAILATAPELTWILALVVPVLIVILIVYQTIAPRLYQTYLRRLDALNLILQENLSGVRVVKAFVREDHEKSRYDEASINLKRAARLAQQAGDVLQPTLVLIVNFSTLLVLWFGGNLAITEGTLTVGQIVAFTNYVLMLLIPLVLTALLLPVIASAGTSLGRIRAVFEDAPDVQDKPDAKPLTEPQGRIVFENVTFSYLDDQQQPTEPPVLKNISFTAEPGEMVAILGATGSGKTSLVNLIPRFYDVTGGRVLVDGVDVRDYTRASLLEHIAPVLQQAVLFSGTIEGNIKFGAIINDDSMIEAARAADADSFISTRADGYDAEVKQRGTNFSGGQKQRLSIARAIARKPKILILDDSTSALDVATETRVQAALAELMHDTTTIVVAQRISTVLIADKILLLDNGEIVAQGTHEDLLANSPIYQEIYRSQLGDPEENENGSR